MSKESSNNKPNFRSDTMSNDLIHTLIQNYRKNHLKAINNTLQMEDSHSIWFDLPKLKKFIARIEDEAAKINPHTTEADLGIRFYYAAYPKIENWEIMKNHPVPKDYAEKHTLVMIPTLKKNDAKGVSLHYDFNHLKSKNSPLAMTGRVRNIRVSTDTVAENSGSIIPPDGDKFESFY